MSSRKYRAANVRHLLSEYRVVNVKRLFESLHADLFADLRVANKPMEGVANKKDASEEEAGRAARHAAALQLAAFLRFLDRLGFPMEERRALMQLFGGLADLENGVASPVVRPVEFGKGSRPGTAGRRAVLTVMAAALTILVQRGMGMDEAAKYISQKLRKGYALPGKSRRKDVEDHVSLIRWREDLEAEKAHPDNVLQYKEILTLLQGEYSDLDSFMNATIEAARKYIA